MWEQSYTFCLNIYFPLIFIEKVVFKKRWKTSVEAKKSNMISGMI